MPNLLDYLILLMYCTKNLLSRGSKLSSTNLKTRSVDVLKQHTGAVPAGSILNGYELGTNLHDNSVLKWNHLKKVALVKKGKLLMYLRQVPEFISP